MGAFHEGHLNLMRAARKSSDELVVSLFVNPTQFGANEDFSLYPRDLQRDAEMAHSVGVDILFAPDVEEIYPRKTTTVHVDAITHRWEGAVRPTHFDGVATVVLKLFHIVQPQVAYFGWKDLQQCLVIKRMVEDLNLNVRLQFEETTREDDGLAMSSRNVYLTPDLRALAPNLQCSLQKIVNDRAKASVSLSDSVATERERLTSLGFEIDYLEVVNLSDLEPASSWQDDCAVIVAARLGKTRLIDNARM